ncbi:hypothetical protein A2U01_0055283, partial [Trifolium medium]|nr:hypothetical protein [Trifolium medium]
MNEPEKEVEHEETVAENEDRPVRQGQDEEMTTVLPEEQLVDEVAGEVPPPDDGLAMTDKDAAAGENASQIAPLKKKQKTKTIAVKQASADMSASVVPEPTASVQEKNDQDEGGEVSKPAPRKRKIKV